MPRVILRTVAPAKVLACQSAEKSWTRAKLSSVSSPMFRVEKTISKRATTWRSVFTATASAIDQITGGIDEASMAVALTAAAADETPWWRAASTGPIEDGRLIDHATAGPLLEGYQNARTEQQDAVIGVIDLTNDRMYWFKLGNTRTTRDASNLEL